MRSFENGLIIDPIMNRIVLQVIVLNHDTGMERTPEIIHCLTGKAMIKVIK